MKRCSTVLMIFLSAMMTTLYKLTPQCAKDYKRLLQKYHSLPKDMDRFCTLTLVHEQQIDFPHNTKNYTLLKKNNNVKVYKAKMSCTTLRGNKLRVVYARHENSIEIIFIELYIKSENDRESKQRISDYLSQFN